MRELIKYVEKKNYQYEKTHSLGKKQDRIELFDLVLGDMEDENIHQDGEISLEKAEKRYKKMEKVFQQLVTLDPELKEDQGVFDCPDHLKAL